jgi:hypothetical protein
MGVLLVALCIETFAVLHSASPLSEMRRAGLPADDFPVAFAAAPIDKARMRPLGDFGGLLWVDGQRVVADAALVADLIVVDATRLRAGERAVVGKLVGLKGVRPLIEAGVIRTYWHLESTVCLEAVSEKDGVWEGRYSGSHVYFTNSRNVGKFAFVVRVERDGTVAVVGR